MNHYFNEYIEALEHAGELVRITRRVDPVLEMAEITDRQASTPHGGKAVLFENTETGIPVVTNLFSSENRIAMAFDVDKIKDASTRFAAFLQAMLPA
ncbi:MAG: menaquinone biosynthesis decarboxylase, partial [Bacteroidales bacterium]